VLSKQPTVTKLVQRMAEAGSVALLADAQDQRRTLVAITASGKQQVRPLIAAAKAHEAKVLRALGAHDVDALKQLLAKLAAI
jgi:DNA-binding MarR family transcriptional regulator